jgi:hypothetical protein
MVIQLITHEDELETVLHVSVCIGYKWRSPRYSLDRRLSEPQSRSKRRGKEKIIYPIGTRTPTPRSSSQPYFIGILGGGVHTGSTRHCGHSWPTVPAPGDCEDGKVGGMNGFARRNRSTRRKSAPTPLCPPQVPLARPGREPGPPRWEASD